MNEEDRYIQWIFGCAFLILGLAAVTIITILGLMIVLIGRSL